MPAFRHSKRRPNQGPSEERKPLRENSGSRNGKAKLTIAQVMEIREMKGKVKQRELAAMFGVSCAQISKVMLRRQWMFLD